MQDIGRANLAQDHGVVIAADFTRAGDRAWRLAEEIRRLAERGQEVGLVQFCAPEAGRVIAPEIQTLVRRGLARIADPDQGLMTHEMIVHEPSRADWSVRALHPLSVSRVTLVAYGEADLEQGRVPAFRRKTEIRRMRVSAFVGIEGAGKAAPPLHLPMPHVATQDRREPEATLGLGWYAETIEKAQTAAIAAALAGRSVKHVRLKGAEADRIGPPSLDRLVAGLDVLIVPQDASALDLPDTLVAAFLAAGREVVVPRRLKPHYGTGPRYATEETFVSTVAAAVAAAVTGRARRLAGEADFLRACRSGQEARLRALRPQRRMPVAQPAERPVLFLPSNGVGVGHMTRLLAVARRMQGKAVFASQAAALEVIQSFGFAAEYLPSAALVGGEFDAWDRWFRHDLEEILDRHDPRMVVYDGAAPSPGLVAAVGSRRDCHLVWMRRAMWGKTTSPFMDNARWFDMILEPGELAAEIDTGITAQRRHEAKVVEPIRLLDEGELLGRAEAAKALGLDPAKPAVLVQLGSGYNRDLLSILDQIMATLGRFPGLQVAIAEWVTGSVPLTLWPQATILRGFPLSQYVRAFDFAISAAGYNSYHELLGFAVPTIFVANQHPTMDDQRGRAQWAQSAQAAFEIGEGELDDLHDVVALLMQAPARDYLTATCRKLAGANGAGQAAARLAALAARQVGN